MSDAKKTADDIQKANCFCNCERVQPGCEVKRDRILKALAAAKVEGMREAATMHENYMRKFLLCESGCKSSKEIREAADKLERGE